MKDLLQARYGVLVGAALLLAACGGGGSSGGGGGGGSSSDDDGSGTGTGGTGSTSGLYQIIDAPQSGLLAHNPASPGQASVSVIDPDAEFFPDPDDATQRVPSIPVLGATWNSGQTSDSYVRRVVYQDGQGHILHVSTDASGGVLPTPQQSSEQGDQTGADAGYRSCAFNIGQDFNDVNNARIAFRRCDTDEWWWTWVGASATSSKPKRFRDSKSDPMVTPLVDLVSTSDGSHDGWLVLQDGEIKRFTPQGALELIPSSPTVSEGAQHLESIQTGDVMLNIDGEPWVYNPSTGLEVIQQENSTTPYSFTNTTCGAALVAAPSSCPVRHVVDDSELFFIDNNKLFRTNLSINKVEELDAAQNPSSFGLVGGSRLAVNNTRAVWSYTADATPSNNTDLQEEMVLRSVEKSTGSAFTLDTVPALAIVDGQNQGFLDRTGAWFFYTKTDSLGGTPTAVAQRIDGSDKKEFPNASWQGASIDLVSFTDLSQSINYVYLLDGMSSSSDVASKNLYSVSASNPTATPYDIGITPSGLQGLLIFGGFSIDRIASITASDGSGGSQQDILYFNGATEGSLQQIRFTDNESESQSAFF